MRIRDNFGLDDSGSQINNPARCRQFGNRAWQLETPRRTKRRTERRRFFMPDFLAAWSADFWRTVYGEPQGSPVPWSGLPARTPFATLYAVAGGDSTQRELPMKNRYAFGGTGTLPGCFVRVGSVVPSSTRNTP